MSASSALYDMASTSADSDSFADLSASIDYLPSSRPMREPAIRRAKKVLSQATSSRLDPLQIVRLIDWSDQPELLTNGDFSRLHHEAQRFIDEFAGEPQLRRISDRYEMPPKIVAIAIMAKFAADQDRRAGRIWSAIFNRLCEDLARRTRLEFMKPLEFFFGEIDGRLRGLVRELAGSVDSDQGQFVMEIASKGEARCLAIIRELADEAEHKLESVIRARIAEAEQDFLQARCAFPD
jgi:uncharacterized protein (DUF1778 family)